MRARRGGRARRCCAASRRRRCARSSPTRWSRCCVRSSTPSRCDLVEQHRERGEPVYIVSATLQEIVEAIADELGFDGALGTVCEVRDGALHRAAPCGRCTRRTRPSACASLPSIDGFDLAECTAYSDSHTDLPFLEAVGHPVVVNPDRELRASPASAAGRCSSSARTRYPHARRRVPPALWAAAGLFGAGLAASRRRRGRVTKG